MHFGKQDLEGTHYYWNGGNPNLFTGQPSRRSFDKFNGPQVLFLINYYGSMLDSFTLVEGKSIEKLILYKLPDDTKSELSVFNWIRDHRATAE